MHVMSARGTRVCSQPCLKRSDVSRTKIQAAYSHLHKSTELLIGEHLRFLISTSFPDEKSAKSANFEWRA